MNRLPKLSIADLFAITGLAVLAIGVGLVFIPAAFIVVGGLLLIYAVLPDQKGPTP